jgi:osmoprotectant transport system substrate-binding protein
VGYEFEQRADGLAALKKAYGLQWKGSPKTMDLGLLYKAMEQGQVTMIAANATDGMLSKMDLKVLRDDRNAFPPYQVCILARQDSMKDTPGLREALLELSGRFTNQKMQNLNYQVDAEHRPVAQVATEFLKQAGLY